jgi:hypothetical protein
MFERRFGTTMSGRLEINAIMGGKVKYLLRNNRSLAALAKDHNGFLSVKKYNEE